MLAGLLVMNTILGPLVTGRINYDFTDTVENQLIGLELVTVLLVAPVTAWAGALALREHRAAPLLAIGPAAYTAYMFVQYVLGPEYDHYSLAVLFHLLLASLSGALVLWAWQRSGIVPLPSTTRRQRQVRGLLLLAFAGFVVLRYAPGLVGAWTGHPIDAEFAQAPTFYWSIFLLDLGVVVPLAAAAGSESLAGTRSADRAALAVLGWFALVPPSVVAMALVMLAREDPNASWASVGVLTAACVVFGAVAVVAFRPLFGADAAPEPPFETLARQEPPPPALRR